MFYKLCEIGCVRFIFSFSPFEVQVGPEAGPQKIRAWGPGLEGGLVGKSADFVVESMGTDVGVLGMFLGFFFPSPGSNPVKVDVVLNGSS